MGDGEPTPQKQGLKKAWAEGQSGNPNGRPKGSRNKLGEAFIEALHNDFQDHGAAVIAKVRDEKPDQYLKVIASLLPKEVKIVDERELSNDELLERIRQLDTIIQPFLISFGEEETGRGASTPHRAN